MNREIKLDFEKKISKTELENAIAALKTGNIETIDVAAHYGDYIIIRKEQGKSFSPSFIVEHSWKYPDSIQIDAGSFMDDEGAEELATFKTDNGLAEYVILQIKILQKIK